ncbi:MAG: hypothetical protein QOF43_1791 [Gaiellaceae bacterium]|nr:hypothetical protein [Gaiellaceae bacterium]
MAPGYLGFCKSKTPFQKEWNCYVSNLRQAVGKARNPAQELPRIDILAHQAGGFLEANCHMMMHVVGRAFARTHHVTLATLQQYLPTSNDPGCSAGFGMGMVIALGPEITHGGAKGAYAICNEAATRFRQYTCFHSLGHAYMRYYDGYLSYGLKACRALGATEAPDCAQGVFHDYWLGLSGQDSAKSRGGEPTTARALCAPQRGLFVIACWYRYYLSLPPKHAPSTAARIEGLCRGLAGIQREGCVASASLISNPDPFGQFRVCSQLKAADVAGCVRGIGTQNLPDAFASGLELIGKCGSLSLSARPSCYGWLGTALTVLTDGRFAKSGCRQIHSPAGRASCAAGAKRSNTALVTFA